MTTLTGTLIEIVFRNAENGFLVGRFQPEGQENRITVVGVLGDCSAGQTLNLTGDYIVHSKFGQQFEVKEFEFLHPKTEEGIELFLSSGLIKGIGPSYASQIVSMFGDETLNVIEKAPQRLLHVPGIGKKKLEQIVRSYEEHRALKEVMMFLRSHNISTARALRIYRHFGKDTIRALTENPYRLCDEISGIGFKTADDIAQKLGLPSDSPHRMKAALLFLLNEAQDDGHCFLPQNVLLNNAAKLLESGEEKISSCLNEMLGEKKFESEKERVYLPELFKAENNVARMLLRLNTQPRLPFVMKHADDYMEKIRRSLGFTLSEQQKEVLHAATESSIVFLTGGPGTGKTTVTKALVALFELEHKKVRLCAPTGRAAKRLSEATGRSTQTIHRLLEYSPKQQLFLRNELSRLECDALIVDECSMIDLLLAEHLLRALKEGTIVIFVGDADQLPSVGAGNFFCDCILSEAFKVIRLTEIFRQKGKELLIENAYRINNGQFPKFANKEFVFFQEEDSERMLEKICRVIQKLSEQYRFDPLRDICVLSPMHKGALGVSRLNQELKRALNPHPLKTHGHFSIGDKVMQVKNNYEKEVFNGDIGIVESMNLDEGKVTVQFPDGVVAYEQAELDELVLAYAATVHKSQGSEFRCVIMPVVTAHYIMLSRNIFYTAVTRAKELVVLFGTKKAVAIALGNRRALSRHTALREKLK